MKRILLCLLVTSCGTEKTRNTPPSTNDTMLAMRQEYLNQMSKVQDADGFTDTHKCDALLHTALLGVGGATIRNIHAARNADGQWFRRPLSYRECLSIGESRSTLSRDMVVGLIWYWYTTKDVASAEAFYQYTTDRFLKFGESDGTIEGNSRIFITPGLLALLAEVIFRAGGPNHALARSAQAIREAPEVTGFEAHLQTLTTILWGKLTGFQSPFEVTSIAFNVNRRPDNAMFQYAAGNKDAVARLLVSHHPQERLPNTADYCNPLRYETETNAPCPNADGSGTDIAPTHFMFLSKLIAE